MEEIFQLPHSLIDIPAELVSALQNGYAPARMRDDDCIHLSTVTIFENLQELVPGKYTEEQIVELLKLLGFNYTDVDGRMTFRWILKKR